MKITIASGQDPKKYDRYEIEDALRTLIRAREIRLNTELMALVSKEAKKQKSAITNIADLKTQYNKLVDQKMPVVKNEEDDLNDDEEEKALEAQIQAE